MRRRTRPIRRSTPQEMRPRRLPTSLATWPAGPVTRWVTRPEQPPTPQAMSSTRRRTRSEETTSRRGRLTRRTGISRGRIRTNAASAISLILVRPGRRSAADALRSAAAPLAPHRSSAPRARPRRLGRRGGGWGARHLSGAQRSEAGCGCTPERPDRPERPRPSGAGRGCPHDPVAAHGVRLAADGLRRRAAWAVARHRHDRSPERGDRMDRFP